MLLNFNNMQGNDRNKNLLDETTNITDEYKNGRCVARIGHNEKYRRSLTKNIFTSFQPPVCIAFNMQVYYNYRWQKAANRNIFII